MTALRTGEETAGESLLLGVRARICPTMGEARVERAHAANRVALDAKGQSLGVLSGLWILHAHPVHMESLSLALFLFCVHRPLEVFIMCDGCSGEQSGASRWSRAGDWLGGSHWH